MSAALLALALLSLTPAPLVSGSPTARQSNLSYYVATTGNDSTGTGSITSPWATISKAISSLRGLVRNRDAVVYVAPGNYRVGASPISISYLDNPINGRLTFRNTGAPGTVRLLGSSVVTGWVQHSGSIYKANVGTGLSINTMWEDGVRGRAARFPKLSINPSYGTARATYLNATGVDSSHTILQYGVGALTPGSWGSAQVVVWSGGLWDWFTDTIPISSINAGTQQITLSQNSRYVLFQTGSGSRFFVQNALDLLTEAGEFFYDSAAGFLYYWPTGNIPTVTIEIPTTKRIVEIIGAGPVARVSNITFDGFAFEETDFVQWYRHAFVDDGDSGEGHANPQYDRQMTLAGNRQGAIYLQHTEGVEILNSHVKNAGMHGVYGYLWNRNYRIENVWIEHVGHSGIYMDGPYPGEGSGNTGGAITNVKVDHFGELVGNGGGIQLLNVNTSTTSHFVISNGPRMGYFLGCYPGLAVITDCYTSGNVAEKGTITNVAQDSGDTGALYVWGFNSRPAGPYFVNTFRNLVISGAAAHPSMDDAAPNGVFCDDETWAQVFQNIDARTGIQGAAHRNNNSGSHTLTNTSFKADGTSNSSFDPNLLDPTIGLTAAFPF